MEIKINKEKYGDKQFIAYINELILREFNERYKDRDLIAHIKQFSDELKINFHRGLITVLNKLRITETPDSYIITIMDELTVEGVRADWLVKVITVGTRIIRPCTVVYDIFKSIQDNLDIIYQDWVKLNGY